MNSLKGRAITTLVNMRTQSLRQTNIKTYDKIINNRIMTVEGNLNTICLAVQFKLEVYTGEREESNQRRVP